MCCPDGGGIRVADQKLVFVSVIQIHAWHVTEHYEQISTCLFRQQRAGGVLVNHRFNAGQFAIRQARDRDAAAARANNDRAFMC